MKQSVFCEYCEDNEEYRIKLLMKTSLLKGEEINYIAQEAICSNCGNEIFVSEVCCDNLKILYDEYKSKHNIVKVDKISEVLDRYYISDKVLSLLLGWEENTISRYLDGDMPTVCNSEALIQIYQNPQYYLTILENNKEKINVIDYTKSKKSVIQLLENCVVEKNIDKVIKHIIVRCEDITPDAVQKLLYYIQSFYYMFTEKFIFKEDCKAYENGPIYKSVYQRYEKIGFDQVNKRLITDNNLILNDYERDIVESVIKFYGCYSSKILRKMTQSESPWILTKPRNNDTNIYINQCYKTIEKKFISQYFRGVREKYNLMNLLDVEKYSRDLLSKIDM